MSLDALARFARLTALPRRVRMNAASPPPVERGMLPIAEMRLIVALEGRKDEVFAEGGAVVHWSMAPGDVLVLRPETWLIPRFHTRHRHLGVWLGDAHHARAAWHRCDGHASREKARHPLVIEASVEVPMPARGGLRQAADALLAVDALGEQDAARHLVAAFLLLLRDAAARPAAVLTKGERTWREAAAWIHDRCHLPIGRDDLARALGVSSNYVSRLCRERGGHAFVDLVSEKRLERAAAMLRAVDLPIGTVARTCGFADAGYFIRCFRRSYGSTPGAYRRTHRASVRTAGADGI